MRDNKPHIARRKGLWACSGANILSYAATAQLAYDSWKEAHRMQLQRSGPATLLGRAIREQWSKPTFGK